MSSNGQYQYFVAYGESPYVSSNYGSTFAWSGISANYYDISTSANGQYVYAGPALYYPLKSTNYGISYSTLNTLPLERSYQKIRTSNDGKYVLINATYGSSYVYLSSNYGASFTQITTAGSSSIGVDVSATGQYMIVSNHEGHIYISSNYGATWIQSSVSTRNYYDAAISSSGQYMTVSDSGGSTCFRSNDYGQSWQEVSIGLSSFWQRVNMSPTGKYQYITRGSFGPGRVSTDFGVNWSQLTTYNILDISHGR